jgi:alpha-1,3-rhamnosyl/mannosyltransferase
MRIGFGVTALCNGLAGGGLDGIGNYTREMLMRMGSGQSNHADLNLVPFAFGSAIPADLISRINGTQHSSSTLDDHRISPGVHFGRYSFNTAWSVATGANSSGIRKLMSQVDLIHATDHYVPKCKPAPMVATLMDAIPLSHPQWLRSEFRSIKNMLWTRAANWADEVITISEYSKVELSKWAGIPLKKITVIPLGVDERWFLDVSEIDSARVRRQYQLPETFFISLGTLQPRKNVEGIIRAHRALTMVERLRTPLVIIGRAGWKYEEVLGLINEDSASGAVRWLQHVPDSDLLAVLKQATAMVFPSLGEGFGLPVLEAFAARVPVITSNTTSLPEVAGEAALSINPLDMDQIAEAMKRIVEDTHLANHLKELGRIRAREFNWQPCADATFTIYQKLAATK